MDGAGLRIELRVFQIEWIVTGCHAAGQDFPIPVQSQANLRLVGGCRAVIAEPDSADTVGTVLRCQKGCRKTNGQANRNDNSQSHGVLSTAYSNTSGTE